MDVRICTCKACGMRDKEGQAQPWPRYKHHPLGPTLEENQQQRSGGASDSLRDCITAFGLSHSAERWRNKSEFITSDVIKAVVVSASCSCYANMVGVASPARVWSTSRSALAKEGQMCLKSNSNQGPWQSPQMGAILNAYGGEGMRWTCPPGLGLYFLF